MKANFAEAVAAAGGDGTTLKFQEGDNNIRVLTNTVAHEFTYDDGGKSTKFLCYVWEYSSNALKLAYLSKTVAKKLAELQMDVQYGFQDMPMPYDVNIKTKNAGTKNAEYEVLAARSNTDVPQEAQDALAKEPSVEQALANILAEKGAPVTTSLPQ
jgi:hypothetical protein